MGTIYGWLAEDEAVGLERGDVELFTTKPILRDGAWWHDKAHYCDPLISVANGRACDRHKLFKDIPIPDWRKPVRVKITAEGVE